MKTIRAVAPYSHADGDDFRHYAFEAWRREGGATAPAHYPPRLLHRLAYGADFPTTFCKDTAEARLRFVQPVSVRFDTWPPYPVHETVPMIWDCWPQFFDPMCRWLTRHRVRTAILTSSQTAERMRRQFPEMNILFVPEGTDTSRFGEGRPLTERHTGLFEIGSVVRSWYKKRYPEDYIRLCRLPEDADLSTNSGFRRVLQDAKVTVVFPRCDTQPEEAGDIETLTQRYWEAMLSRMVMVGRAPKELTDLIGYNPVIDMDTAHPTRQLQDIIAGIDRYQPLVDRNRATAIALGDWRQRMRRIMDFLRQCGYNTKETLS